MDEEIDKWFQLPFYSKKGNQFEPLTDLSFKSKGHRVIGKLIGIDSMDEAKSLCNQEIYINRDDLPALEEEEYYYVDLIGCQCYWDNQEIGVVKSVNNYGSCDIFQIISKDQKEFHIPFLNKYVKKVDIQKKVIYFVGLEGFF